MNARLGKEAMGRLVLEASTGMHGAVAKQIALELAAALEAQQAGGEPGQGKDLHDKLMVAIQNLLAARNAPAKWGSVGPDAEDIAWDKVRELVNYICVRIDSPPPYTHPAPVQQVDALLPDIDAYRAKYAKILTLTDDMCYGYECAREELRAALAAQPAAERVPFDPLAEFGFMLEQRRDVWVVVDDCGGTTPASLTERVMWDAIVKSRGITATSGKEGGNG